MCSQWNLTGSILSVASEDGRVRLFKGTLYFLLHNTRCAFGIGLIVSSHSFLDLSFYSCLPATYAGVWQLYGTFSAEAPADDASAEAEDDGRMHE